MRLFVTMNVCDYMADNVRRSHRAAAERWGMDYLECVAPRPGDLFAAKHDICSAVANDDWSVWVDADALVRADCPPFWEADGVEPDHFVAVQLPLNKLGIESAEKHWSMFPGVKVGPLNPASYFNGGVFAFNSHHTAMFGWVSESMGKTSVYDRETGERLWHLAMIEQTLFNMAARLPGVKLALCDPIFNLTEATAGCPGLITHYAGGNETPAEKRAKLEAIDWSAPPAEVTS